MRTVESFEAKIFQGNVFAKLHLESRDPNIFIEHTERKDSGEYQD